MSGLWMCVVDRVWDIFWRVLAAFAIAAAIPAGVLFGLRVVGIIVPKVAQ